LWARGKRWLKPVEEKLEVYELREELRVGSWVEKHFWGIIELAPE
jgi:hypothetical protein